jgi:hypothetical protein
MDSKGGKVGLCDLEFETRLGRIGNVSGWNVDRPIQAAGSEIGCNFGVESLGNYLLGNNAAEAAWHGDVISGPLRSHQIR